MLSVRGLHKHYTQHLLGRTSQVLAGADLEVGAGMCVVLTGGSGSGKTTLLRCIYGQALADRGSILIGRGPDRFEVVGAAPRDMLSARHRLVGLATQFLDVVPRVTPLELLSQEGLEAEAAAGLLAELGLPNELHTVPPATFSGGQRQILNLALTLARTRPLLLLDEATASLDSGRREAALRKLKQLKRSGAAIVASFHDVPADRGLVDSVLRMEHGRLVPA